MFCHWTPVSELAKRWRDIEARGSANSGWRYKVVELAGRQIRSLVCLTRGPDLALIQSVLSARQVAEGPAVDLAVPTRYNV